MRGFAAVIVTSGLFLAYVVWVSFRIEWLAEQWYGLPVIIAFILTAPAVWMLIGKWMLRLMGERI